MNTSKCKNCGYLVEKTYCSKCGQKNSDILDFTSLVKELFQNVFDLDSRFFLTINNLFTKPGFLTTEYWSGRRSKYLNPFRMYIITSVLYYAVSSLISNPTDNDKDFEGNKNSIGNNTKIEFNMQTPEGRKQTKESVNILLDNAEKKWEKFSENGNSTLFWILPFLSIGLLILSKNYKHLHLPHHIITVIHIQSALYCFEMIAEIFSAIFSNYSTYFFDLRILASAIYIVLSIKHIYNNNIYVSLLKVVFLLLTVVFSFLILFSLLIGISFLELKYF